MSEKTLKVHPAASAFPKITGKDLKELSLDVSRRRAWLGLKNALGFS
jgi:hypothetical protein